MATPLPSVLLPLRINIIEITAPFAAISIIAYTELPVNLKRKNFFAFLQNYPNKN
jgi:hypothetical protein